MGDDMAAGFHGGGRVRLRTLIVIRWMAIAGQLAGIFLIDRGLGLDMPVGPALAVVAVSVLLNFAAMLQRRTRLRLGDRDAALYLGYDLVQLTVLLFLTGGLQNPFAVLLLAPLTVSATILSRRSTTALTVLTMMCITALAIWHYPLPAGPGGPMTLPPLYNLGVWIALTLSTSVIAAYVWSVADEARRIGDAFAASQMALAREQQLSALGALAAAAAHELGTPLSTIAVVARELARDLPRNSPLAADVALLLEQTERCRQILTDLTRQPETPGGEPYEQLSVAALVEAAAEPHRRPDIELDVVTAPRDGSKPPLARRTPELIHGLGNILQNALQFAHKRVTVRGDWSRDEVRLNIADDGPGFPPGLIGKLGEPYLSGRGGESEDASNHMGLGIFIAATLLERSGARLRFANGRHGGAQVAVRWDRHKFESGGNG